MKILGHPLHIIIVGPTTGFILASSFLDICYWYTRDLMWQKATFWVLACTLVLAFCAITAGLVDFINLRNLDFTKKEESNKIKIASFHMLIMTTLVSLLSFSFVLRIHASPEDILPSALLYLASFLLPLGAWLGGELVLRYRLGFIDTKS